MLNTEKCTVESSGEFCLVVLEGVIQGPSLKEHGTLRDAGGL